jgi:error-prone DNA polymerase
VATAGAVIVRQRPGTAKGFVFLTLEDETGMCQAIVRPDLFRENRAVIVGSGTLIVEGRLQKQDGTLSVKGERFRSLQHLETIPSHDFRSRFPHAAARRRAASRRSSGPASGSEWAAADRSVAG